jgi:hypothetical protein
MHIELLLREIAALIAIAFGGGLLLSLAASWRRGWHVIILCVWMVSSVLLVQQGGPQSLIIRSIEVLCWSVTALLGLEQGERLERWVHRPHKKDFRSVSEALTAIDYE